MHLADMDMKIPVDIGVLKLELRTVEVDEPWVPILQHSHPLWDDDPPGTTVYPQRRPNRPDGPPPLGGLYA